MRNLRVLAVCALLLALVPALDLTAQRPRGSAAVNHVVIITLDGFGGWAFDDPHLPVPTLRRLAAASDAVSPSIPSTTWTSHPRPPGCWAST